MTTHSIDGRPWASLSSLKPGDILFADSGFTCIRTSHHKQVMTERSPLRRLWDLISFSKQRNHDLFVLCDCGQHFLDGQLPGEDNDSLVGFWNAK